MGAAPMALPRQAGAGGIMMGIPTQPFRAGLTFSGRPSGPLWDLWQGPSSPKRDAARLKRCPSPLLGIGGCVRLSLWNKGP
jgi:hypothetical protein